MGHSSASAYNHGFHGWKEHSNSLREDTDLITLEFLRKSHPDYHVTRTTPAKCDLLGYAAAGYATASRDNDESYDALRYYKEPESRLEKEPGVLADQIQFGRWSYTWEQKAYLVYEVEYTITFQGPRKLLFVLSPRSQDAMQTMHHVATEELLLASGAWTTDLHEEVYVFDDAQWKKDKGLWKSVQDASWDDVILNGEMKTNLIKDVQGFFDNQQLYKKLAVSYSDSSRDISDLSIYIGSVEARCHSAWGPWKWKDSFNQGAH
jgi:transitional endoplasmic reticulum ATPase